MDSYVTRFSDKEFFLSNFGLQEGNKNQEDYKIAISQTYFAFTSLSTVGFGDFYPISDYERLMGSVILLLGVSMFSYIMSKFIEMMDIIKDSNKEMD